MAILSYIIHIGYLVCFILVVIKMFQHGHTALGIVTLLLCLFCGLGTLLAFVYGWMRARDWGIQNVMIVWTVLAILAIAMNIFSPLPLPVDLGQLRP